MRRARVGDRLTRLHGRAIGATLMAVVGSAFLTGCSAHFPGVPPVAPIEDARTTNERATQIAESRSTETALAAAPAATTAPEAADAEDAAYPGYPGLPTADPESLPRLHEAVAGLSHDTVLHRESAERWWPPQEVSVDLVHVVLAETSGEPDLVVTISDARKSTAVWTFQRDGRETTDGSAPALELVRGLGNDVGFIVRSEEATSLSVLAMRAAGVVATGQGRATAEIYVRARLPFIDREAQPNDFGVGLAFADWSGDGTLEALLRLSGKTGTSLDLYAVGNRGTYEPVARFSDPEGPIVDYDGDGVLEHVGRGDKGSWVATRWDGHAVRREEMMDAGLAALADGAITVNDLPPIPTGLYAKRWVSEAEQVVLWPQSGGQLVNVAPGAVDDTPLRWTGDMYNAPTTHDMSADGRLTADYEWDQVAESPRLAADPDDVPEGAWPDGTIYLEDRTDSGGRQPLVRTFGFDQGDFGGGQSGSVKLAPSGEALAWSDGVGLWTAALPEGPVTRLKQHGSADPYGLAGVHRPEAWSPDGRYLLGSVGYFEGGSWVLWDTNTASGIVLDDTFSYVGGYSDLVWLADSSGMIHLRSGGDPSGPLVSIVSARDPRQSRALVSGWWQTEGSTITSAPHVFDAVDFGDGTIGFGMQSQIGLDDRTNGVYRVRLDGTDLQQLVPLPALSWDAYGALEGRGRLRWAPDQTEFLFEAVRPVTYERYFIVGDLTTAKLWDATDVLKGAGAFAFGE